MATLSVSISNGFILPCQMLPSLNSLDTLSKQIEQLKPSHISSELITIRAKTITGMILSISIRPTDTVLKLKQQIFILEGVFLDQQRIIYNGKQLEEEQTIQFYNIQPNDNVHLILRLRGGMFHESSARKDYVSIRYRHLFDTSINMIYHLRQTTTHSEMKSIIEELYVKLKSATTEQEMEKIHNMIQGIYLL
jgi:hypothetical protein